MNAAEDTTSIERLPSVAGGASLLLIRFVTRRGYTAIWASLLSIATVGVIVLAYRSPGYAVTNVSLNDGGIWVTHNDTRDFSDLPVGRFDNPVRQIGEGITAPGSAQLRYNLDVYQAGSNVLLLDIGKGELYPVDPAAARPDQGGAVAIPTADQVRLGAATTAILDPKTGKLWTASVVDLTSASPKQAHPTANAGGRADVAVGLDGSVYVASGAKDRLLTVRGDKGRATWTAFPTSFTPQKPQVTVVGSTAVVLDASAGLVAIPSRRVVVRLPPRPAGAGDPVLQQPGPAAAAVLVADNKALYQVPLHGGTVATLSRSGSGSPANPVRLGSCDYAAWAGSAAMFARACDGVSTYAHALGDSSSGIQRLVFRVNNGQIILNEPDTGYIWGVDDKVERLDDWNSVRPRQNPNTHQRLRRHQAQQHSSRDRPPVARPDHLGVRLGQSTILHPLDNDFDPDGDLLAITKVSSVDSPAAQVEIVSNGQALKVTVNSDPGRDIHFRYTIDDGRGKQGDATVTVHVYPLTQNTAPTRLASAPKLTVSLAGTQSVTMPILGDWRDREGDSLFISGATASQGTVSISGPALTYTAPPAPGTQELTYTVGDGVAQTKQTIAVDVLSPAGQAVPPTALPDVVSTEVGTPVTIRPLANDLPGADPTDPYAQLLLTGQVVAPAGVTVTTDPVNGTITATGDHAQTYLLSYTEAFGSARPVTGRIRLDISAPEAAQPPITLPDVAVLHGQDPTVIDPIANDVDPQNALLVVQSVTVDGSAPIQVAVEQHHWLLLRGTQPLGGGKGGTGTFVVHYTVSDGLTAPVQGDVVVSQEQPLAGDSPPIPQYDTATVRAGSSTEVSVLANDTDPQGEQLSLVPGKLDVHSSSGKLLGSAWAVDGVVRYVAPPALIVKTPQRVSIDYQVRDTSQNTAIGQMYVTVNPASALHDSPPNPLPLYARLDAGQQVTLHIPVYNVDPDGDVATFTGVTVPPKLGRIVSYGPDSVVYQAYPRSSGSDQFTYQVADPYGETGTATVQLSVAPAVPAQPPVATDDEAVAAPGRWVHVDVLANDLVAEGDPVALSLAQGQLRNDARVEGNRLLVRAPQPGLPPAQVAYVLTDGAGDSSSAVAAVRAVPGFDNPPVARDDYVNQPARGTRIVTADVRANDDDPDNPRSALRVISLGTGAHAAGPGRLRITLGGRPRLVPYEVSDGKKTSEAYVHVPAFQEDRPVLRAGVATLQIPAGGSRQVSLAAYVTDPRGPVRLTTLETLRATPESKLTVRAVGDKALLVKAAAGYRGPGSVSFEVTDGRTLGAKGARHAVLSLPVRVGPETPELRCPGDPLPIVVGAAPRLLDLANVCLVWLDDPSKLGSLTYRTRVSGQSTGLLVARTDSSGRHVTIRATPSARSGATVNVAITTGGFGQPATGTLTIRAISAPAASVRPIGVDAIVGKTITINTASALTSPFGKAATPRVLGARAPAGLSVAVSGTTLTIRPHKAGTVTFTYRITDVTARPDRAVAGVVTVRVQGSQSLRAQKTSATQKSKASSATNKPATQKKPPPEAPTAPGVPFATSVGNAQVVLAWTPPANNGTPIDQYQVSDDSGDTWSCLGPPCTIGSKLKNGTTYRFRVEAHNAVGWGPWSDWSQPAQPDQVPGIVSGISGTPGDGSVSVSWPAAPDTGSPVTGYDVQISPGPPSGSSEQLPSGGSATFTGLTNGTAYSFKVRAKNSAGWGDWSDASAAVMPFGAPGALAAPTASGADSADAHEKAITVTWAAASGNGRPISKYTVTPQSSLSSTAGTPVTVDGNTTTTTFTVPNDGASWTYAVVAANSGGLSSPASPSSSPVQAATHPDSIASVTASDNAGGVGYDGAVKLSFAIPTTNGLNVTQVNWQSSAGGSGNFNVGSAAAGTAEIETVNGLTNGGTYTFTLQACNADGCGGWSAASNAVSPYGPPGAPSAGAGASGTTITFSWSGGGGGGRPIADYQISVDGGGWQSVGPNPGSTSPGYGYSQTHSVTVRVVDSAGQVSGNSNTASATTVAAPPPPPSISISKGGAYAPNGNCNNASCAYVNVQMSNFSPNTSYSLSICGTGAGGGCSGNYPFTTDGGGNKTINGFFYYGWAGTTVTVRTSTGVVSNGIVW